MLTRANNFGTEGWGMENDNLQQLAAVWALAGLPPEALALVAPFQRARL